jgi:nucleotide-binding universal stress UspA family protein
MSKRILIAVDGSTAAHAALAEAIKMAKAEDAELRLVHVVDETSVSLGERDIARRRLALNRLAQIGERLLSDAQNMIRAARRHASCARLMRQRNAETVSGLIAAEATDWGADLIVIGSLGHGPIRRILRGSTDAAVMRSARVPVLPVRPIVRGGADRLPAGTPGRLGLA